MLNRDKNSTEMWNENDTPGNEEVNSIPVMEEKLTVGKKTIETGKVKITKHVNTVEQLIDIPVVEEEVIVQRVPVNQYVETSPPAVTGRR